MSLTPEGRGQVVTHALYTPREMESLRAKHQGGGRGTGDGGQGVGAEGHVECRGRVLPVAAADPAGQAARRSQSADSQDAAGPSPALRPADPSLALRASVSVVESLRRELSQLQERVAELDREMAEMRDTNKRLGEQLRESRDALGG